ncbi:MAG: AHH domain-containing protein [Spirulinaceae cyanobacterium]
MSQKLYRKQKKIHKIILFYQWRNAKLDAVDQEYQQQATQATSGQREKINQEKSKGEEKAAKHLENAEKEAEKEKQKADKEATNKKEDGEKESDGFWGWAKSKAKSFIDGVKQAVNFVYDNLRKAVKGIFEAAKKLATAAIDLARQAIVGLIKGFGEILKGLVKVVFAAFPGIAKKINAKIDQAIQKAEKAVNAAADLLKKGISAVLDFLANTLDSLLGLIQDIYNGALTVIGMIVNGEFAELFKGISNLVASAKTAPGQFETAGLEELLGGNLDQPLSPQELAQAATMGIGVPTSQGGSASPGSETSELPTPPWTTENVGVDGVENNLSLSPEIMAQLMEQTDGNGEVLLGESNDQSRSMEAILAEATGEPKQAGAEQTAETIPDDGLTPKQRAEIKWGMMKQGISKWWSDNWPMVMGAGVLGVAGFIAANIATGGAITAALPTIMAVVGPLFAGVTIAQIGGHIRDYLAKGWAGELQPGGKSLAKGLAAGAIELVSWLTFKVGGAALKGGKAVAKGAKTVAKGGIQAARKVTQAVIKGAKYLIKKGKVLFKGIAGSGVGKQFKRLGDLGQGLLNKMRFKAFRIRVANRKFKLEGQINPWVLLATGELEYIEHSKLKGHQVGDIVDDVNGQKGIVVGWQGNTKEGASRFVQGIESGSNEAKKLFDDLSQLDKEKILSKIGGSKKSTYQLRKGIPKPHPDNYQAHHIMPEEIMGNKEIKDFLDEMNFDFQDGTRNGVILPPDDALRIKGWENATIHRGSHPNYTVRMTDKLTDLRLTYEDLLSNGVSLEKSKQIIQEQLDDVLATTKENLMKGTEALD